MVYEDEKHEATESKEVEKKEHSSVLSKYSVAERKELLKKAMAKAK